MTSTVALMVQVVELSVVVVEMVAVVGGGVVM